jgi:hypothetical protein
VPAATRIFVVISLIISFSSLVSLLTGSRAHAREPVIYPNGTLHQLETPKISLYEHIFDTDLPKVKKLSVRKYEYYMVDFHIVKLVR